MQDGIGQMGAGFSDMRPVGDDLQHARQPKTADEFHVPVRMVRQEREGGGPMKEHLAAERERHKSGNEHAKHHMQRHYMRGHDSQYGHDNYKYKE